jgi:uncharacterized protein (DUF2336 family)
VEILKCQNTVAIAVIPINLISDLESAIATGSHKTGALLHRITDLFLIHAGHYSPDQLAIYDDVLLVLVDKVEIAARAVLAKRLAPIDSAPANTIRSLALDDAIEVAEPILAISNVVDDKTLVDCIAAQGQDHLLAIATRNKLSETVTDKLVAKGDNKVLGTLVTNPGADISDRGFGLLVRKSVGDDWLSECIAERKDIPDHHFRELVSQASDIVRRRLIKDNPELCEAIGAAFPPSAKANAIKHARSTTDYRTAELCVKSREITDAVVNEFAQAKKIEEVIVSIAQLSGLSAPEIERLIMGTWTSPIAIIFKAIGLRMTTVDAIYRARLQGGGGLGNDGIRTKAEFIAVSRPTAERIMRFFRVRKSAEFSVRS